MTTRKRNPNDLHDDFYFVVFYPNKMYLQYALIISIFLGIINREDQK